MSKKSVLYIFSFLLVILLASFFLFKNITKPNYYLTGAIESSPEMAEELSSYSYIFFSVHEKGRKMPYGARRQFIRHDFSKGAYHFVLDETNFFVMSKGSAFPESFTLKVKFSKDNKVSGEKETPRLGLEKNSVKRGDYVLISMGTPDF